MRILVLGAGFYGCHIASSLIDDGHDVTVHEKADRIFAGASGSIPARLHSGQHYPRSGLTRAACQEHQAEFMAVYGHLTHSVRTNIYAIAAVDSLVDFSTYCKVLKDEIEYIRIPPEEFGLRNVEGAILTGERHVVIQKAIAHFSRKLEGRIVFGTNESEGFDWIIDCTFCANESAGVDRYEPCITALLDGPSDWAVTIMDGGFPSLYPWDEADGISSLTSAKHTPLARVSTYAEARAVLDGFSHRDAYERTCLMLDQIKHYWPQASQYRIHGYKLSIRAMPRSGSDARLVDVVRADRTIRIRAGKLDAVFHAARQIKEMLCSP